MLRPNLARQRRFRCPLPSEPIRTPVAASQARRWGGLPGILARRGRACTSDAWRLAATPSLGIFIILGERDVGVATLILSEALDVIALGTRSLQASS